MFKKILALLLVLCMLLCISACGIKDTVSDISSDTTATEITQSQTEETTDNTESKVSTPTTTPSRTQSAVQPTHQPVPQPQHTHSYTTTVKSATCTEQGYTTYTCSCGNTYNANFVTPSHKYTNYKCSVCGDIDKEHIYEYLLNWIIENGTVDGQYSSISYIDEDGVEYNIAYQASNNIIFHMHFVEGGYYRATGIIFEEISGTYKYIHRVDHLETQLRAIEFSGDIKSSNFTNNTPLSYDNYTSDIGSSVSNSELNVARYCLVDLLIVVEGLLRGQFNSPNNSGLTLKDLGFDIFIDSILED